MTPTISIGLPVRNGERYVERAIASVLGQDYEDFELIISDNSSTDRTAEICRDHAARDRRVRYLRTAANIGAVPNFNRVFALARGRFFKWQCHDDECYPWMLSRCLDVLERAPASVVLTYPLCELIDERGRFHSSQIEDVKTSAARPHQRLRRFLLKATSAQALCGLIRTEALRRTGLRGSYVLDDCGLLAELAMLGELREVPEVLLRIRVHAANARELNPRVRDHAIWLDPANRSRRVVLPPKAGLLVEHIRSIARLPLAPIDRLLCYAVLPVAACERPLRNFAGRQKARLASAPSHT